MSESMTKKSIVKMLKTFSMNVNLDKTQFEAEKTNFIIMILSRANRKVSENTIIFQYLCELKFIKSLKSTQENYLQLVAGMSAMLRHESKPLNSIIFRFGDIRNKFYIILRGKVSVLIPTEKTVLMTYSEFVQYLMILKENNEIELLKKVQLSNKTYILKESDMILINKHPTKNFDRRSVVGYIDFLTFYPNYEESESERKLCTIYEYNQITTLGEGDKFGDYAFGSTNKKRMASIITIENTDFATLNSENYEFLLKDVHMKIRNNNIKWLMSGPIIDQIDRITFDKKFYNYFVKNKINQNEILSREGDEMENIFFIKNASFTIECRLSLIEIRNLIVSYGGNHESVYDTLDESIKKNPCYQKFLNKPRTIKVAISCSREIFGLNDTSSNNKSIYSFKCSEEGEYYSIQKSLFEKIHENNDNLKAKIEEYLSSKKHFYSDRLQFIERTLITKFKNEKHLEELQTTHNAYLDENKGRLKTKRVMKRILEFNKEHNSGILITESVKNEGIYLNKIRSGRGNSTNFLQIKINSRNNQSPRIDTSIKNSFHSVMKSCPNVFLTPIEKKVNTEPNKETISHKNRRSKLIEIYNKSTERDNKLIHVVDFLAGDKMKDELQLKNIEIKKMGGFKHFKNFSFEKFTSLNKRINKIYHPKSNS